MVRFAPQALKGRGSSNLNLHLYLRYAAEIPAAILVVVEVVVLFAGVLARYVFQAPLIWSDELASILFLWLAMLGSVIALQRPSTCASRPSSAASHPRRVPAPRRSPSPPSPCSC